MAVRNKHGIKDIYNYIKLYQSEIIFFIIRSVLIIEQSKKRKNVLFFIRLCYNSFGQNFGYSMGGRYIWLERNDEKNGKD